MKKLILSLVLFIALTPSIYASSYLVNSDQQLASILSKLAPGDEVIIKDGNYNQWAIEIGAKGTAKAPITIRSENEGKVIFSGEVNQTFFKLTGSYLILKGITFKNCILSKLGALIVINDANYCTVTKCNFISNTAKVQFTPLVIVSGKGTANQITDAYFSANVDNQDIQVKITKESSPLNTLIQNNLFENKAKVTWKNNNGGECIQIGQDPVLLGTIISKSMVRFNRFIKCNAEGEVISNKSSNNTYFKNYFEDNDGELVMRGGHDCIVDGNIFKGGTGGIRVNGTGHSLINNRISQIKTAIRLMYGMAKGKSEVGFYIAASGCSVKNNQIDQCVTGILVGDNKNLDWTGKFDTVRYPSPVMQSVAPFDNEIKGNIFRKTDKEIVKQ